MDDFRARLRRMRREEHSDGAQVPPRSPADPALSLDPPAGLVVREGSLGGVLARERHFAAATRHGDWRLEEIFAADARALSLVAHDPALVDFDPARALFLDTETSGLSGGAGTYVFLVGLGSFEASGFQLWQGFLREPADEPALLAEVARRLAEKDFLVTFFGKAFDRHRLQDRMRVHRIAAPFAGRAHLDLYHPCRRIAWPELVDGRLRTMERALAAVERASDLPGSQAPAAWFDWLAGRPHRLEGVFRHNQDDVLSLVVLAAHLGRSIAGARGDGRSLSGCERARARALARACSRAGERADARAWLERVLELEHGRPDAIGIEARIELARFCADPAEHERARALLSVARDALDTACTGRSHARWSAKIDRELARLTRLVERATLRHRARNAGGYSAAATTSPPED